MNKEAVTQRLRQLNSEMLEQMQIASDIDGQQSDDVIRARKEVVRIQHDIAYLLEEHGSV